MRPNIALPFFATASLWVAACGCSTPAQRAVYQEKLSSEVRVLEDQLYEADYENRVLRDELDACRRRTDCAVDDVVVSVPEPPMIDATQSYRSQAPIQSPPLEDNFDLGDDMSETFLPPTTDSEQDFQTDGSSSGNDPANGGGSDSDPEPMPFEFDPGVPFEPLVDPADDPMVDSDLVPKQVAPKRNAPQQTGPKKLPEPSPRSPSVLPPAPTRPEPPGLQDLLPDPIIDGDILPPPRGSGSEELPPGRIEVPDFGGGPFQTGPPVAIRVHPSGGGAVEQGEEVFWVTLEAIDKSGRVVDLNRFDIDANLSLVVTDPASELPDSAEPVVLGRWDFNPVQTASMVGDQPVPGIHIPVRWDDRRPVGDEVTVHARLRGAEEVLRCEGALPTVREAKLASQWLPRGTR